MTAGSSCSKPRRAAHAAKTDSFVTRAVLHTAQKLLSRGSSKGAPLFVTGVSPGQAGDTNLWWSTTAGYLALDALAQRENPWATQWRVPDGTARRAWLVGRETPKGNCNTWGKYRADDMTSNSVRDPGGYYDLPNVPDTQ
jgi:hypothetical protein